MTATNHALTGATIGLLIGNPILALPAALLSHFVCDVIPHYGASDCNKESGLTSKIFKQTLILDALLCIAIVVILFGLHPYNWLLASACAFVATSPDLLWINRYLKALKGRKWRPNRLTKFASDIQWFQKPIGAVVELVWAAAAITLISAIIR